MGSEAGGPLGDAPSVQESETQSQIKMRKATANENVVILSLKS